jgi:hypothetical protein
LIVEDNPPEADPRAHEMRRSGFGLAWGRVDTAAA